MANRIFIAFAIEDANYRDLLKGQSLHPRASFEYVDMSAKEPWSSAWKTNCRTRIKGCDGVIALLSADTINADGARWEIRCAKEEGIPMIGMWVSKTDRGPIPPELSGHRVVDWSTAEITSFIDSL